MSKILQTAYLVKVWHFRGPLIHDLFWCWQNCCSQKIWVPSTWRTNAKKCRILYTHQNLPCFLHKGNQKSPKTGINMESKIVLPGKLSHILNWIYDTMRKLWCRSTKLNQQKEDLGETKERNEIKLLGAVYQRADTQK